MYAVQIGLVQAATPQAVAETEEIVLEGVSQTGGLPVAAPAAPPWREYILWGGLVLAIVVALGIIIFLATRPPAAPVSASPAAPGDEARWQIRADLPTPRSGLGLAALENRLYAIAGESAQGVTGLLERYNPDQNAWETLAEKPTPVGDVGAVVIGGKIYMPGGRQADGEISAGLEIYDPARDRWERGADLPAPVSAYALAAFEGALYLFGGWDGSQYLDIAWRYDPGQDAWEELEALPTERGYARAAVAAGRIFVLGGYDGERALDRNDIYQPAKEGLENPWTEGLPLPSERYAMGVTSAVDIIYVVGGTSEAQAGTPGVEGQALSSLEYIPTAGVWREFTSPVTENWAQMGMVLSGTQIYVVGGELAGQPSGQNLAYQAIYTVAIPSIIK
jgi:N-acetylneuraminic acid mutarotase